MTAFDANLPDEVGRFAAISAERRILNIGEQILSRV